MPMPQEAKTPPAKTRHCPLLLAPLKTCTGLVRSCVSLSPIWPF